MRLYRLCWRAGVALFTSAGVAAAIVSWSVIVVLVIFGGAVGLAAVVNAARTVSAEQPIPWHRVARGVTTRTVMVGTVLLAFFGATAVLGFLISTAFILFAAIASPGALSFISRRFVPAKSVDVEIDSFGVPERLEDDQQPTSGESVFGDAPLAIASMTDDELCLAWRRSFSVLRDAVLPRERLRIVELRQQYLDELGNRHPDGIASWLVSGPRAASDLTRYLKRP